MMKLRWFRQFEKEESWLNEMASQGFHFSRRTWIGGYVFDKGEPRSSNYRIDYRVFKRRRDYEDYVTLFADSGWTLAFGSRHNGVHYFRQEADAATEDIFSDELSKAGRYKRASEQFLMIGAIYACVFASATHNRGLWDFHYLTPGLWDKKGGAFVRAFLFETPFVLMRGLSMLLILAMVALFTVYALMADRKYKKAIRDLPK